MQRVKEIIFYCLLSSIICSCAPTAKTPQGDLSPKPEEIYTFSIPANSISREIKDTKPDILKGFPFISFQPVTNFRGKYPPEFYSTIRQRWNAEALQTADIWKLRYDQQRYDVIYTNPLWIGDLSLGEGDYLKNIVYSHNLSEEQFKVLENWIKEGGIFWIESAVFISSYDYNLNNFSDSKLNKLIEKIKTMTLFGHKLHVSTSMAKRIDEFNTEKLSMIISPDENLIKHVEVLDKQINNLLLEQTDYVGIYITLDGEPIVKSGDKIYASYINYGKGKIITLVPFGFKNVHYDGEMLRLDLLLWSLNDRK
jgi:hypothetical protein